MDLGVWMAPSVWRHKREADGRLQAWNLAEWPDGLLEAGGGARLYVAIEGHWRGYFLLGTLQWNPADRRRPITVSFDPRSWTPIDPLPAPPRPRRGFSTLVPPR